MIRKRIVQQIKEILLNKFGMGTKHIYQRYFTEQKIILEQCTVIY